MAAASQLVSFLAFVAALLLIVLVTWAPFLISERIRVLFDSWPTASLALNYPLVGAGVVCVQVLAYLAGAAALGGVSSSTGPVPFFGFFFGVNLAVPLLGWLVAAFALTRYGAWDPTAGGFDGRAVLALGALWYAVVVSAAEAVLVFVLTFLFLPL